MLNLFLIPALAPALVSPLQGAAPHLNKRQQLERFTFWDNRDFGWFEQNIPFWESPDSDIDKVYYYRWELVTKHQNYGSPETGYIFTEFINRPPWSGRYGAISCPVGFQIHELRWLKDRRYLEDFSRYWHQTPGAQPRSYSNWIGDALWNAYKVTGDRDWLRTQLPFMEAQYEGWVNEHFRPEKGLFAWSGMHDGMETNIASRQTPDWFAGAESYRPTLNAYVYGDLKALAAAYRLEGNQTKSARFDGLAQTLKSKFQSTLWDSKRQFFSCMFANNEEKDGVKIAANTLLYDDGAYKGSPYGRQLIGYVPWMFGLPDPNRGYEVAWKGVTDPSVFFAPHGLYTVERRDPLFLISPGGCVWSGNNWPYAQSQTLQAMANVVQSYPQNVVSKEDYFKVFKNYTKTHLLEDQPYLAENSDPDTGKWVFDEPHKSEHYFHSSYCDLLITGLAGLMPREDDRLDVDPLIPASWDYFMLDDVSYRGRSVTLVWDRNGSRYRAGKGLSLWIDGRRVGSRVNLGKLSVKLPPMRKLAPRAESRRLVNVAVNNDSRYFPKVTASSTQAGTALGALYDGLVLYHAVRPANRWVAEPKDAEPWVVYDFGVARRVQEVKLYPLDDGPDAAIRAPESVQLEAWTGSGWIPVRPVTTEPQSPQGHRPFTLKFAPLDVRKLRVRLKANRGAQVGLSEFEAWGDNPLPLAPAPIPDNLARAAVASASFTSPFDRVEEVNDGVIAMDGGRNRWTAYESKSPSDWVELAFPSEVEIGVVSLCFYDDGGGVKLPLSVALEAWDGTVWRPVTERSREPKSIVAKVPNEIQIVPVRTTKLRVNLVHNGASRAGISEILVFAPSAKEE